MRAVLLSVGKTDDAIYAELIEVYRKRINFYLPFELEFIPDIKKGKGMSEKEQKIREGEQILNRLQPGDYVVLLDDKGKHYTSTEIAPLMVFRMKCMPNPMKSCRFQK